MDFVLWRQLTLCHRSSQWPFFFGVIVSALKSRTVSHWSASTLRGVVTGPRKWLSWTLVPHGRCCSLRLGSSEFSWRETTPRRGGSCSGSSGTEPELKLSSAGHRVNMATEAEPTDLIKVLHLLVLSFTWGMQVWVSFIAGFALVWQVSLHTFGLVQSKLFPVYFYCLLGSNCVSLAVYAVYHPRDLLDWHETIQMTLYFVALVMTALNSQWFGPAVTEKMLQMREVEKEHGLGDQIGMGGQKEAYAKLRERDPKYGSCRKAFGRYHGLSSLCNLIGVICTTVNLVYTALNLSTI